MLELGRPSVIYKEGSAILENTVTIDGKIQNLWFKVDAKYGEYLCHERNDAYLIACLNYAMRNHHDIVSLNPVTEDLLYNIETYLIPALIENNPDFYNVKITSETSNEILPSAGRVGTGISCGVDSLNALASHTGSKFPNHNITTLTFNNVGSHGVGEEAHKLYESRIHRPRQFADEYGFEFVASDSNLMDVIEQNHFKTHTYSSMFPVFCLQKLYSVYNYASSGYKYREFNLKDLPQSSCGSYELLSLQVFSTPQIKILSEGMGFTRLAKLKNVVNYQPSYRYLNVCLKEGDNCGVCEKCVRTLLGIDALGALEKYRNVFDIDAYKSNRGWYLQQMIYRIKEKKHDYFEMYPYFKNDISLMMKAKGSIYGIVQRIKNSIRKNKRLYTLAKDLVQKN